MLTWVKPYQDSYDSGKPDGYTSPGGGRCKGCPLSRAAIEAKKEKEGGQSLVGLLLALVKFPAQLGTAHK